MHRIDTANVATVLPAANPVGSTVGYFQNADPINDIDPTKLDADWFNDVQENIVRAIMDADGGNAALVKGTHTQLKDAIKAMIAAGSASNFLTNYMQGLLVSWNGVASITIATGLCRDSTDAKNIVVASPLTVSLTTSGANGLDTGAEATSTWYYPFVAMKADGTVCGLLSISPTAPTLPTGYIYQRRLPCAIRNYSSGDIIPFDVHGWPNQPFIKYKDIEFSDTGITCVLNNGNATSFTDVSLASFVPPESRQVLVNWLGALASSTTYNLRRKGDTSEGVVRVTRANMDTFNAILWMETDSNQLIQYLGSSGSADTDIYVYGFRMP